jgi:subtilase family serine protease
MCSRGLSLAVVLATVALGAAHAAPYPQVTTPKSVDLGAAPAGTPVTVTIALKLRNPGALQEHLQAVYTQGSPQYHHFMTTQEFASAYGPDAATVAQVTRRFQAQGLTVTRLSTTMLQLSGTTSQVQHAFGTQLRTREVPATATTPAYRYHAPDGAPQLSQDIAGSVQGVFGLDTRPRYRPHLRHPAGRFQTPTSVEAQSGGSPNTTDQPGFWTVVDFGEYYNVDPLYKRGIDGSRQTLGIMTLASFTTSDVTGYWKSLGLKASASRIKVVEVDGGSGPPSDASGSDETTLDVQQSGGIAPGAKVIVYEAPNTNQGFIDGFAAAIDANVVDTLSTSWGQWEYLDELPPPVEDPVTGRATTSARALNDLFLQAAIQGQTLFCASGDAGAYDASDVFPQPGTPPPFAPPVYTKVLSVDDPAAQQFIVAAGGTTLPGKQVFTDDSGKTIFVAKIATEQVWGWDYLQGLCNAIGAPDPVVCGIFPAGSGGGVSSYVPIPFYQLLVPGIRVTEPGQVLIDITDTKHPQTIVRLPSGFHGRNVPDLSVNADPETGYIVPYTSDFDGPIVEQLGGTSFSSPQLNGVASLYNQALGRRLGLLNVSLYDLVRRNAAYGGSHAPLRDIVHGDNWFYSGHTGYDQGTGVGVPDVANLLNALQSYY